MTGLLPVLLVTSMYEYVYFVCVHVCVCVCVCVCLYSLCNRGPLYLKLSICVGVYMCNVIGELRFLNLRLCCVCVCERVFVCVCVCVCVGGCVGGLWWF